MKKKLQITTILFTLVLSLIIPTTTYAATKSNAKALQKAKPKITMTANDEQLTVKTNKVKSATKYQYMYDTSKNFKNAKRYTTTSRTFTLKTEENKNYYVKCRAVVKVNNKNYYSKWSEIKAKIITEKGYDETVTEEAVWLCDTVVFKYDGYMPESEEDFKAHQLELARAGLDPSYTTASIYGPSGTSQKVVDSYIKKLNESNRNPVDYRSRDIYLPCKSYVVHHKAKYKIKTL